MADSISILVADDHPLFREGVVHSLAAEPDIEVVGQASCGEDALRMACDLVPDVVLLDITMPGWGGIVTAEKITIACPTTKVMMLTVMEDESKLLASFKAGARAYVLKGVSAHELARVVRSVAQVCAYRCFMVKYFSKFKQEYPTRAVELGPRSCRCSGVGTQLKYIAYTDDRSRERR